MLTGDNGILTQAGNAKDETIIGQEKEEVELAYTSVTMSKLGESVTAKELQMELDKSVGNSKTIVTGGTILKVRFKDTGNLYTISSNKGVEEYKKAEVTPVYAFLCDTDGNGAGETLVLSSTETIEGYTIITDYGDNEAYQTNEDNADVIYGNVYYYPIWKNDTSSITNVIIYNKIAPTTTERWFSGCSKLEEIENISYLNTSNVTTMVCMFMNCSNFTSLDLSDLDTSSVADMRSMFYGCSNLMNLDVSNFDTQNVIFMNGMFTNCSKLTNLNLNSFNTSKVTGMNTVFLGCSSLTNLGLSSFDTSNVTDMAMMFEGCNNLTSLNLSNFDTTNVTNMMKMFYNCSSLTGLDLSCFNTEEVYFYDDMLSEVTAQVTIGPNWNSSMTESATGYSGTFSS